MTYSRMKLRTAEIKVWQELEEWAAAKAADIASAALDKLLDRLVELRAEYRRGSAHYRKARK